MIRRGKAEKWAARSERLAASLRENLKRRTEQARGRAAARPPDADPPPDAAGEQPRAPDFRRNRDGN